jgi:hypothetical protein
MADIRERLASLVSHAHLLPVIRAFRRHEERT